jgi:hypothetical protein
MMFRHTHTHTHTRARARAYARTHWYIRLVAEHERFTGHTVAHNEQLSTAAVSAVCICGPVAVQPFCTDRLR